MDLATIQAIGSVLLQIVDFIMKYGPSLLTIGENVITDLKLAWASATSGTPITADQQTTIDNALEAANTALQASVAAAEASDNPPAA